MPLKNLTFTEAPTNPGRDPIVTRRQKLIERLEEQISLAKNPEFAPKVKRWRKNEAGERVLTEITKRVSPWWVTDQKGEVYLSVRSGLKRIEFEKGKTAIKVGGFSKLEGVLRDLIGATQAGELDNFIPTHSSPFASKKK
jgi:hypothetical protein